MPYPQLPLLLGLAADVDFVERHRVAVKTTITFGESMATSILTSRWDAVTSRTSTVK